VGEELRRVIPVIKLLSKKISVPLSVDTYKPQVANAALDNGAVMVNDISGLRNDAMIKTVSRHKAAVTIMHMKGIPRTMQRNIKYGALINEVTGFLTGAIKKATDGGIEKERIVIDPGVGFGKELKHNLRILRNLAEFKSLGLPIMVGVSRKSFIGKISGKEATDRLYGSLAAEILALREGANLLRVHDVAETKDALDTFEAIRQGWN
jgi:dihydropteroate synthase